jgi:hypothetical protein
MGTANQEIADLLGRIEPLAQQCEVKRAHFIEGPRDNIVDTFGDEVVCCKECAEVQAETVREAYPDDAHEVGVAEGEQPEEEADMRCSFCGCHLDTTLSEEMAATMLEDGEITPDASPDGALEVKRVLAALADSEDDEAVDRAVALGTEFVALAVAEGLLPPADGPTPVPGPR